MEYEEPQCFRLKEKLFLIHIYTLCFIINFFFFWIVYLQCFNKKIQVYFIQFEINQGKPINLKMIQCTFRLLAMTEDPDARMPSKQLKGWIFQHLAFQSPACLWSRALVAGWEGGTIDCVTSQLVTSSSSSTSILPLLPPATHSSHALPEIGFNL